MHNIYNLSTFLYCALVALFHFTEFSTAACLNTTSLRGLQEEDCNPRKYFTNAGSNKPLKSFKIKTSAGAERLRHKTQAFIGGDRKGYPREAFRSLLYTEHPNAEDDLIYIFDTCKAGQEYDVYLGFADIFEDCEMYGYTRYMKIYINSQYLGSISPFEEVGCNNAVVLSTRIIPDGDTIAVTLEDDLGSDRCPFVNFISVEPACVPDGTCMQDVDGACGTGAKGVDNCGNPCTSDSFECKNGQFCQDNFCVCPDPTNPTCGIAQIEPSTYIKISELEDSIHIFWLPIAPGDTITCNIYDSICGPELYTRVNEVPTLSEYDCHNPLDYLEAECEYGPAEAEDTYLFVGVYTYSCFVNLRCDICVSDGTCSPEAPGTCGAGVSGIDNCGNPCTIDFLGCENEQICKDNFCSCPDPTPTCGFPQLEESLPITVSGSKASLQNFWLPIIPGETFTCNVSGDANELYYRVNEPVILDDSFCDYELNCHNRGDNNNFCDYGPAADGDQYLFVGVYFYHDDTNVVLQCDLCVPDGTCTPDTNACGDQVAGIDSCGNPCTIDFFYCDNEQTCKDSFCVCTVPTPTCGIPQLEESTTSITFSGDISTGMQLFWLRIVPGDTVTCYIYFVEYYNSALIYARVNEAPTEDEYDASSLFTRDYVEYGPALDGDEYLFLGVSTYDTYKNAVLQCNFCIPDGTCTPDDDLNCGFVASGTDSCGNPCEIDVDFGECENEQICEENVCICTDSTPTCGIPQMELSTPITITASHLDYFIGKFWIPISPGDKITCAVTFNDDSHGFFDGNRHLFLRVNEFGHITSSLNYDCKSTRSSAIPECEYGPAVDGDEYLFVGVTASRSYESAVLQCDLCVSDGSCTPNDGLNCGVGASGVDNCGSPCTIDLGLDGCAFSDDQTCEENICICSVPTPTCGIPQIEKSTPITLNSGNRSGTWSHFWLPISLGDTITCTISTTSGSQGDADLYMRVNDAAPTLQQYDCLSDRYNSNEVCEYGPAIDIDDYLFVGVYAHESYNNVVLQCDINNSLTL